MADVTVVVDLVAEAMVADEEVRQVASMAAARAEVARAGAESDKGGMCEPALVCVRGRPKRVAPTWPPRQRRNPAESQPTCPQGYGQFGWLTQLQRRRKTRTRQLRSKGMADNSGSRCVLHRRRVDCTAQAQHQVDDRFGASVGTWHGHSSSRIHVAGTGQSEPCRRVHARAWS